MSNIHKNVNKVVSDHVHKQIPSVVMDIVEGHLKTNEEHCYQHNREILDEIISDLHQYAETLPTVNELEVCNVL